MLRAVLHTQTKFLCNCPEGEAACPYCLGLAGALPLPNRAAFDAAVAAAKALGLNVQQCIDFLRALDASSPRGWRVATTPIGISGDAATSLWIEEEAGGDAALCIEGYTTVDDVRKALLGAGIAAGTIEQASASDEVWHPMPDLPGVLL